MANPTHKTEQQPQERLNGVVNRIRFHSEDTGYTVLSLLPKGQKDTITVVGAIPLIKEGETLECLGYWKNDPKFGLQFKADAIQCVPPDTAEGIEKYLASGMIRNIGPKFAKQLVKAFGVKVFEIIENEPERLLELPGIGPKRVESVKEAFKEQKAVRDIMVFLQSHGVGPGRAVRIYKVYGDAAIAKVKENPYRLSTDINGIGFKIADEIAQKVGIPKDSIIRVRAGLNHVMSEAVSQGHCYQLADDLIKRAMDLLEVGVSYVDKAILEEVEAGGLIVEAGERFYLPNVLKAEKAVARHIQRLKLGKIPWRGINPANAIRQAERMTGITLSKSQAAAVEMICTNKVALVSGGPGVGKTATLRTILTMLGDSDLKILLCAPTGKAAKRMNEATGWEAKTIHRTLEYDGETRDFRYNNNNPLPCDLLVIDETSMVDVLLMNRLLEAVPNTSGLLIIGDKDQLPSVGPGSVLNDFIQSGVVATTFLTEIFRQAASSRIITNAHLINRGLVPEKAPPGEESDFYFIAKETPEEILGTVLDLVSTRVPKLGYDPIKDIQVLAPMRNGPLGVTSLNIELKKVLNPGYGPGVNRFGRAYHVGDRIIQMVNNYDRGDGAGIFNGDQGVIVDINTEDEYIMSDFDGVIIKHEFSDLDEIQLCYSCTIHKSQGSDFPVVIMPLYFGHYMMLQRNLVYTGCTRGKKLVIVVGQPKAMQQAVRTQQSNNRLTRLRERLLEA